MYIPRQNEGVIFRSFESSFITGLLGSRRVGKSTLVKQFSLENPDRNWVFLNMDNLEERQRIDAGELKNIIQEKLWRELMPAKKAWVAIDEAQKCPALFDQIKLLYDYYKDTDAIKFILTGSGMLSLHQLSAETLAGRIDLHYLREFNLAETVRLENADRINIKSDARFFDEIFSENVNSLDNLENIKKYIQSLLPLKPIIEKSLQEQLIWGGFPEMLKTADISERLLYLQNYFQTYLEKDIRAITTINDVNMYQKLLEIIAEQTGSVRQDKEIIVALGCSRDTLKKYRGYLLATLMYQEIYPFIGSTLRRVIKSPKGYLLNNGLITYLTGLDDVTVLEKTGLIGHRLENWFLKELQIALDRAPKRSNVYYWRTTSGQEVDFVVEQKPHVYPFEVTYSPRIQEKKVKNLLCFMEGEKKAKIGFYVYTGEFGYDEKRRLCYLPVWALG